MAVVMNGITLAAVQRYIRGPGGVYKDFTSIASPGTLLGETAGDSEFDPGYSFHDVEPAGARGLIKAHRAIDKIVPKLTVSLLESTTTNLGAAIPGFDSADETPTAQVEYLGTGLACQSGVALTGAGDTDFDTLEIWYGGVTGATQIATINTDYTVNETTGVVTTIATTSGGHIADTDEVTAHYSYDSTASGDAFTIFTPAQIASTDHWTNVALVCQLTNSTYSNPYFVLIVKNVLNSPSAITIPGDGVSEAQIKMTFEGYYDPSVGTAIENAPFEWWVGRS